MSIQKWVWTNDSLVNESAYLPFSVWHILPSILDKVLTESVFIEPRVFSQYRFSKGTTSLVAVALSRKDTRSRRVSVAANCTDSSSSLTNSIKWGNRVLLAISNLWDRKGRRMTQCMISSIILFCQMRDWTRHTCKIYTFPYYLHTKFYKSYIERTQCIFPYSPKSSY